jgi:hypothetical protein
MKLSIEEVSVLLIWLQSRIKEVGVENLSSAEQEMIGKVIISNDDLLTLIKKEESDRNFNYLCNWVNSLPNGVKEGIMKL